MGEKTELVLKRSEWRVPTPAITFWMDPNYHNRKSADNYFRSNSVLIIKAREMLWYSTQLPEFEYKIQNSKGHCAFGATLSLVHANQGCLPSVDSLTFNAKSHSFAAAALRLG